MSLGKYQIPLGSLPQKAKETLSNDVINSDFLDFRNAKEVSQGSICLLYTSPSPRDLSTSRMPSSA